MLSTGSSLIGVALIGVALIGVALIGVAVVIGFLAYRSFEYIKPPDGAFGALVNGSWNGLVGMAVRGVIQFSVASVINYFDLHFASFDFKK